MRTVHSRKWQKSWKKFARPWSRSPHLLSRKSSATCCLPSSTSRVWPGLMHSRRCSRPTANSLRASRYWKHWPANVVSCWAKQLSSSSTHSGTRLNGFEGTCTCTCPCTFTCTVSRAKRCVGRRAESFRANMLQQRRHAGTATVHVHVNVHVHVHVRLRVESVHHARERNRFADVWASADPGDGSLQ